MKGVPTNSVVRENQRVWAEIVLVEQKEEV